MWPSHRTAGQAERADEARSGGPPAWPQPMLEITLIVRYLHLRVIYDLRYIARYFAKSTFNYMGKYSYIATKDIIVRYFATSATARYRVIHDIYRTIFAGHHPDTPTLSPT